MTSDDRVRQLFSDEEETDTDTNQTGNGSTASFYSTDRNADCFETNRSVVSVEADVHRTPADNLGAKAVKSRKVKLRSDESSTSTDEGIYQELEGDETDDSSARFSGVTVVPPPPPPPPPPPGNTSSSPEMEKKTIQSSSGGTDNPSESEGGGELYTEEASKCEPKKIYVTRQQLSFIPPQFDGPPEVDVNIKPSEYLKKLSPSNHKLVARADTCQDESKNGIVRISCYTSEASKRIVDAVPTDRQTITVTTSLPPGIALTPDLIQKVQLKKTEVPDSGQRNVLLKKNDVAIEQKQKDEEIRKPNDRKTMDSANEVKLDDDELFSTDNFVEKMPSIDSNGCPIPLWKRQVMAKKAAEKAKKEAEDQRQKEAEEKWHQTVPAWKRQLLQRKEVTSKQQEPRPGAMGTIVVTVNSSKNKGNKLETLVIKEADKPPNPGFPKLHKSAAR